MERGLELATGVHARRAVRAAPRADRPRRAHDGVTRPLDRRRHHRRAHVGLADAYAGIGRSCGCCRRAGWSTRSGRGARTSWSSRRSPTRGRAPPSWSAPLDNLVKGAAGQAIQNMNLILGLDESTGAPGDGGLPVSVTFPRGFAAAGISGRAQAERAARPRAAASAEPGDHGRGSVHDEPRRGRTRRRWPAHRLAAGPAAAVLVNSGQANAATGERGVAERAPWPPRRPRPLGWSRTDVLPCSTGVIGEPVHMERARSTALPVLSRALTPPGGPDFAHAIMTTDTVDKQASAEAGGVPRGRLCEGGRHDRTRTWRRCSCS